MRLQDKVAFISGAASGIGRVAAALFAKEGAALMLADRDAAAGHSAAEEIAKSGGNVAFVQCDVTNPQSVEEAIQRTVDRYGRLTVLSNNAAGCLPGAKHVIWAG